MPFGEAPIHDWHFNMDGLLNVAAYADISRNPYVVGSDAYNIAHGLPLSRGWEGIVAPTAVMPSGPGPAPAAAATTPWGTATAVVPAAPSNLPWVALIVLGAILAFR